MKTRSQSQLSSNAASSIRPPVSNDDDAADTQVQQLRQRLESIASTWISALQQRQTNSMDDQERAMLKFFTQQLQTMIPANCPCVPKLLRPPPMPEIELLPEMVSYFTLMYGRILSHYNQKRSTVQAYERVAFSSGTVHEFALQWLGPSAFATAATGASRHCSVKAPPAWLSATPSNNPTETVAECDTTTTNETADDNASPQQISTSVSPVAMMYETNASVDPRSKPDHRHDILVARGLLVSLCHASRCTVPDYCCGMSKRCAEFRALWQHILSTQQQQSDQQQQQVCCGQPCCIEARAALRHLARCRRSPREPGRPPCELCEPLHAKLPRLLQETERNNQAYQVMVGDGAANDSDSSSSLATIGVSP